MRFLKFSASWCNPCKAMASKIETLKSNTNLFDGIDFSEIDVDDDDKLLADRYNVESIPVIIAIDSSDNEVGRLSGNVPEQRIEDFINEHK